MVNNLIQTFSKLLSKYAFYCGAFLIINCGCSPNNKTPLNDISSKDTFKSPISTLVKNPSIILLDTCPKPRYIAVPVKAEGSYALPTSAGNVKINLKPPKKVTAGFFSTIQNYSTEQGLALSTIDCAFTDRTGNLWFGTGGGGVSRFNGKSFTNFTTEQGLANNNVSCITEDKKGNIWIATVGGGVSKYDGKSFTNFTIAEGLPDDNIWNVIEDRTGNMWFATNSGGVSCYNGKSFTNFTTKQGLAGNSVFCIIEDKNNNLWFGTNGAGLSFYDGKNFKNFSVAKELNSNSIHCLQEDREGNIWIGTISGGLGKYDGKSFTSYTKESCLKNNTVWSLYLDKKGNLWIGTNGGGVSKYDGKSFTNFTTEEGLQNNIVLGITEDKTQNIWFGTDGNGICCYNGSAVVSFSMKQGLPNNTVWSIASDKQNNLWFGTDNGACKYDGKSFTQFGFAQGFIDNSVLSITADSKGNMWLCTNGNGVSKYDGESFTTYSTKQGLANNSVFCSLEDMNGNIWFGTNGGGVSKYDGKSFTNFSMKNGLPSDNISSMAEDKQGNIWIGTNGGGTGGVSRFDGKSFTNYSTDQGLCGNNIYCIVADKQGNVWFGSDGAGISLLRKKTAEKILAESNVSNSSGSKQIIFENYTKNEGLADNSVYAIAEDSNNNIILGTNLGFTILKSGAYASERSFDKAGIEYYNRQTGYPVKDINSLAMYVDAKGILWAGTGANELIRFNYSEIFEENEPMPLEIESIKIDNENIVWNDIKANAESTKAQNENLVAPNIIEEILAFNKKLTQKQRVDMRKKFSGIKFDSINSFYPIPQNLVLPYKNNNIKFDFAAVEPSKPGLINYQYLLDGYDNEWSSPTNETTANFGHIHEGTYSFRLKAQSPNGTWTNPIVFKFEVLAPWYRTWWAYTSYVLVFLIALWGFIKWRISTLRKEKILLEEKIAVRTHELQDEKEKVERTLTELKSTQAQLIQSEKMASLGELTAGIAHEIQNPLNFVNNFSEVNKEMLEELKAERIKPKADRDDDLQNELINDLIANSEKIDHHGKRADSIVKSMLQHSRVSTGRKEPTDINALADEYLRLSYHGIRAKDKTFNVALQTDFDSSIGKINIVPQDIGRVLLNLFNNAFYSVHQKNLTGFQNLSGLNGYEPTIFASTKKLDGKIEIHVRDNGVGIPQKVVDKIFQPFFTTKPTGQGTGLGLSLAYDIIKAHGGEIRVDTKEGEGAEFVIGLPLNLCN